jgi:hypothetical protein
MNMARIRQWHAYIGLFIAPGVLFFAITGALQLFGLHEAHGGYRPVPVVEKLSSVHKDQVFALGEHHSAPQSNAPAGEAPPDMGLAPGVDDDNDRPAVSTLVLKGFFFLEALALSVSTLFGLWMSLVQRPRNPFSWVLLATGSAIPIILLIV